MPELDSSDDSIDSHTTHHEHEQKQEDVLSNVVAETLVSSDALQPLPLPEYVP